MYLHSIHIFSAVSNDPVHGCGWRWIHAEDGGVGDAGGQRTAERTADVIDGAVVGVFSRGGSVMQLMKEVLPADS